MTTETLASTAALNLSVFGFCLLLLLGLFTSAYVKVATVLVLLKIGLGLESLPRFIVSGALAVGLSFFVMYPTIDRSVAAVAEQVDGKSQLSAQEKIKAFEAGSEVWKSFAIKQAHQKELVRFSELAIKSTDAAEAAQLGTETSPLSWRVVAPAFLVSEMKEAFATGLALLIPLLIVDLFIAHILAALGLLNVNAHLVAFPFKILLFVMADGWSLITANLVSTYAGS